MIRSPTNCLALLSCHRFYLPLDNQEERSILASPEDQEEDTPVLLIVKRRLRAKAECTLSAENCEPRGSGDDCHDERHAAPLQKLCLEVPAIRFE